MEFRNTGSFAEQLDKTDPLRKYRDRFYIPEKKGEECVYFTGNSLGLQPRDAEKALETELEDWKKWGVEGHFKAENPWFSYHKMFKEGTAEVVGAKPSEVTVMNGLTVNLHLLMVSFYRPRGKRTKIICESKAFPSDQYVLESQVRFHGYDPGETIIEISPREGEHLIREEDILKAIKDTGDELALVMLGGVNYYTGQAFDMKKITQASHDTGAIAGFDLAHAAGNLKLELHDWGLDFAAWCSYKYLNSGPGSVSGIFVHERHENNPDLPRFAGWWGYPEEERFQMKGGFKPAKGADGWQLSNAGVFSMAVHKISLDIFREAGMDELCEKRDKLTAYLEFIITDVSNRFKDVNFEIITPSDKSKRGCQISVLTHGSGKDLFDFISKEGVVADWREPNVIRMAPVPLYNSFYDVYRFGHILEKALKNK